MKVRVTMDIEIPDGYDIDDIENYLEYEFGYNGYNCMMTYNNPLDKDNVCIEVEDMTVEEIY